MRSFAVATLALGLAFTAASAAAQSVPWQYEGKRGELEWGKLDPAYRTCAKGHEQSPIDIRGARLNKTLKPIEFHYIAGPVRLENDGHTIVAHVDPGSYILVNGVRYDLVEFEFHHPGEEPVRGKLSDLSVHLIHRNAEGKTVILAVRLVENMDSPNAVLATLWPHLPRTTGASEKVTEMVSAGGLLPTDRGYWSYTGSLTAPPCTEGVQWFVFEQELTLSRDQLRIFASLFRINSRSVQDTHGRRIEANE
jgi:carbonic anhydrase